MLLEPQIAASLRTSSPRVPRLTRPVLDSLVAKVPLASMLLLLLVMPWAPPELRQAQPLRPSLQRGTLGIHAGTRHERAPMLSLTRHTTSVQLPPRPSLLADCGMPRPSHPADFESHTDGATLELLGIWSLLPVCLTLLTAATCQSALPLDGGPQSAAGVSGAAASSEESFLRFELSLGCSLLLYTSASIVTLLAVSQALLAATPHRPPRPTATVTATTATSANASEASASSGISSTTSATISSTFSAASAASSATAASGQLASRIHTSPSTDSLIARAVNEFVLTRRRTALMLHATAAALLLLALPLPALHVQELTTHFQPPIFPTNGREQGACLRKPSEADTAHSHDRLPCPPHQLLHDPPPRPPFPPPPGATAGLVGSSKELSLIDIAVAATGTSIGPDALVILHGGLLRAGNLCGLMQPPAPIVAMLLVFVLAGAPAWRACSAYSADETPVSRLHAATPTLARPPCPLALLVASTRRHRHALRSPCRTEQASTPGSDRLGRVAPRRRRGSGLALRDSSAARSRAAANADGARGRSASVCQVRASPVAGHGVVGRRSTGRWGVGGRPEL